MTTNLRTAVTITTISDTITIITIFKPDLSPPPPPRLAKMTPQGAALWPPQALSSTVLDLGLPLVLSLDQQSVVKMTLCDF